MILRFHAAEEKKDFYLNICTQAENYNYKNCSTDPYKTYIEVSKDNIDKIYSECLFNDYFYNENLTEKHEEIESLPFQ